MSSSSLRRALSLNCADPSSPPTFPLAVERRRHPRLSIASFCKPRRLPTLPSLRKPCHRISRHGALPLRPPSANHKQEGTHRRIASSLSMPVFPTEYYRDCSAGGASELSPRDGNLDMQSSIVYRDLYESMRQLELPGWNGCLLRYEGALMSPAQGKARELSIVEEKSLRLSSDSTGTPMSLRMLKRKLSVEPKIIPTYIQSKQHVYGVSCLPSSESRREETGDGSCSNAIGSVGSAFSSLVFMMESLQQHMLWLRRFLSKEADACMQVIMEKVCQDMQDTFLWLFQKVFACTPMFMLLTMMLLVDFTTHSMGEHVALDVMPLGEPPTSIERLVAADPSGFGWVSGSRASGIESGAAYHHDSQVSSELSTLSEGGAGDGVVRVAKVGGGMDGKASPSASTGQAAMTAEDDTNGAFNDASNSGYASSFSQFGLSDADLGLSNTSSVNEDKHILNAMLQQVASRELNTGPLLTTRHLLVAPVRAPPLEADDYACYDRTDLTYQDELSRDPSNPLLLANYAQFLHVVRHDHVRADKLYKRAVKADPVDGELMGKYASFLWVAKEDAEAADEAFKAAMAADPSNVYHAGSYAHFLWSSGAEQEEVYAPTASYQVSTS